MRVLGHDSFWDKACSYAAFKGIIQALPQNLCGSPLCHASVTEWCIASGFKVSDTERKERCARLAGDVAAYAVELLNQEYDSQFTPIYIPPESIAACMSCHGASFQDNVAAKMECIQCHGDPHATTAVEERPGMPTSFALEQNYPTLTRSIRGRPFASRFLKRKKSIWPSTTSAAGWCAPWWIMNCIHLDNIL